MRLYGNNAENGHLSNSGGCMATMRPMEPNLTAGPIWQQCGNGALSNWCGYMATIRWPIRPMEQCKNWLGNRATNIWNIVNPGQTVRSISSKTLAWDFWCNMQHSIRTIRGKVKDWIGWRRSRSTTVSTTTTIPWELLQSKKLGEEEF